MQVNSHSGCSQFRLIPTVAALLSVGAFVTISRADDDPPNPAYVLLMQDILINADLWSATPEILSAGYGFEGISGVPGGAANVIAAGGAWQPLDGFDNPPYRAQTSAPTPAGVALNYGYPTLYLDAMPVVFSWPVLPSTVRPQDFLITLNTGDVVQAQVASITPNFEYNERNTVVIFGEFGNRLAPSVEGSIHPVSLTIASSATLMLYGPDGAVSAAEMTKESSNPYVENGGPTLVGAKLSFMSTLGEGAPPGFDGAVPNDGVALYGEENAQFRLRVLTTGGFSPDGVTSVLPTDFATFFRLRVSDQDEFGNEIELWLTETNVTYETSQGSITILGLADLGVWQEEYDVTYVEDHDNQIDIVLKGDEAAMRLITHVEIPASGDYRPFYNPGGPGMNPTPGVTYTQPGPYTLQPVMMCLDDPFTVTYVVPEPSTVLLLLVGGLFLLRQRSRRSH